MATKTATVTQEPDKTNVVVEGAHKVLLVGLGALMLTQDQVGELAGKMVERGKDTQAKAAKRVSDFRKKESKRVEDEWEKQAEKLLHRMNVPSRSEIDAISLKISRLTKKVDELSKSLA